MSSHAAPEAAERAGKRSVSLAQSLIKEVEERAGKSGFSSVVAEALEEWLAAQKLREVVTADRKAFGPVSAEARRQAEQEW
ncbi:hypothetical protein AMK16_11940 [Streptomyces sp. CB00455]|uniref:hypothetical protein n=1 Tax=Streptomyces sp. CB00455 TaxID=1703927 RepID=UPI00093EAB9D|nr:hypothetical protein [Streptomyces sp. CB00455]OKK21075.1 hypothetical protein AMK16_11940 [Streptomyces sp. CB00455]